LHISIPLKPVHSANAGLGNIKKRLRIRIEDENKERRATFLTKHVKQAKARHRPVGRDIALQSFTCYILPMMSSGGCD
jgi:hypothetical protein